MKKTMIILFLALVSWGVNAQHDHAAHGAQKENGQTTAPMFKDKALGTAYGHYIQLKDALVASKPDDAKTASEELVKSLQTLKGVEKARQEAAKVASANSIYAQRKAFTTLSNEMASLVKNSQLSMGEVYLEYCPMANGNSGGYWLSNEKEIRNPYFGDKMLKCGSVKETIQ